MLSPVFLQLLDTRIGGRQSRRPPITLLSFLDAVRKGMNIANVFSRPETFLKDHRDLAGEAAAS